MANYVVEYEANISTMNPRYNATPSTKIDIIEGESGTRFYERLIGKPQINGYELQSGDNSLSDIGVTQLVDEKLGNVEALLATI